MLNIFSKKDGAEKPENIEEIQRLVEAALSYIDSTIFTVLGKVAAQVFFKHTFTKKMFVLRFFMTDFILI
jgi:hypothetical protein